MNTTINNAYWDHREEVIEKMEEAYRRAAGNRNSVYNVYLDADGEVWIHEAVAGSNSMPESAWNGEAELLHTYCFAEHDADEDELLEVIYESIREHMEELDDRM